MKLYEFIIIIPTYNQEILLEKTLASLSNCEFDKKRFKVVVVENGCKGKVENIVEGFSEFLNIEYLYEKIGNKSNALNKVLSLIEDSFVILFDDDIRIEKNVLSEYSSAFSRFGPGYFWGGSVGPDYEETGPPDYLIDFFPASVKGLRLGEADTEISSPDFLGCNWAFYSEDLKEVGLFNVNFGPGSPAGSVGQETDAITRLFKVGKKGIYLPKAKVWHYIPKQRSNLEWLKSRKYRNGVRSGIIEKNNTEECRTFLGLPLWFYKFYLNSFFKSNIVNFFISDKKEKIKNNLEHCQNKGMLKGFISKGRWK
jgi:glycosyltransferase involved in cell wall biosynthesis